MKQKTKPKSDWLPGLGALGLIFVIFYFFLVNFSSNTGEPDRSKSVYALFYKLYPKLGYRFKTQYTLNLVQPRQDLLIYFDYDGNDRELAKIRRKWVKPGGTLLIAGIKTEQDPISLHPLKTAPLQSGRVIKAKQDPKQSRAGFLNLKGENIKHLSVSTLDSRFQVILTSRQGPLLYRTKSDGGRILVLTDSALLKNDLLKGADVAVFVNELLKPYFGKRIYLMEANGIRQAVATPIFVFLFQNKLRFVTLQILLISLLFLIWQGKRFGAPQRVAPYARRSLSGHLRAVGNWYRKTNALTIVDEINCEYFKYLLQKATGLALKPAQREEQLAKIAAFLTANALEISPEQLDESLTNDPRISLGRLQRKLKLQEQIIQALEHCRIRK